MQNKLEIGAHVRYVGPTLLGESWGSVTGTVVRLPLDPEHGRRRRDHEKCVLVQVGNERRPRPVRPEELQVVR